jgi:hypothetical protein
MIYPFFDRFFLWADHAACPPRDEWIWWVEPGLFE